MKEPMLEQQPNPRSSLESTEKGDVQLGIDKYQVELTELLSERNFDELNVKERSQALKLMKQIEALQQKQLIEKQEKEQYWTREMFIDWVLTEVDSSWDQKQATDFIDKRFDLTDISAPRLKMPLSMHRTDGIRRIPPGLIGDDINFRGTKVQELPANLKVKAVYVGKTDITEICSGFSCSILSMDGCSLEKVGTGLQIYRLMLSKGAFSPEIEKQLIELKEQGQIKSIAVYSGEYPNVKRYFL